MIKKKLYIIITFILIILMVLLVNPVRAEENKSNDDTTNNKSNSITSDTNIRILPTINANVLGNAKSGDKVQIITTTNNWAFIQDDNITGWVILSTLNNNNSNQNENNNNNSNNTNSTNTTSTDNTNTNAQTQNSNTTNTAIANTTSTNTTVDNVTNIKPTTKYIGSNSAYIRSQPSTDSQIVATLIKNTDVKVTGEQDGWYKITYNNIEGYIRKDLITDNKTANLTNTVN